MINRTKNYFANLSRKQIVLFAMFLGAALFAFFMARYGEQVSKVGYIVLFVELMIIVAVTWGMAGHTVIKSLFGVSVGLSLLIYLAQSYCDPIVLRTHSGDVALMSLVGFGVLYVGYEFFRALRNEVIERIKILKEINNHKKPWIVIIPYGLFTGLFVWQIAEVLLPIINSLCIYQHGALP